VLIKDMSPVWETRHPSPESTVVKAPVKEDFSRITPDFSLKIFHFPGIIGKNKETVLHRIWCNPVSMSA
jgi:hypothetical protein